MKRWNELKLIWDFISVENFTSVFSQLFTCTHMNWDEMKVNTEWISYRSFWPKWKFKPTWDFNVKQIYPKWNELAQTRWILRLMRMCVYGCNIGHFDRYKISFRMIKYHMNTTRNEMPTHVHQNVGPFWIAAEMKRHVNRSCFHASLKSQTGMGLFHLSHERTLTSLWM